MTRSRAFGVLAAILISLNLLGIFAVLESGQAGRNKTVQAARDTCLLGSRKTILFVNMFRADEIANSLVAHDSHQPAATRRARTHEYQLQDRALIALDKTIDPSTIQALNPIGRRIVAKLGRRAYSCVRAHPLTGLIP